MSNRNFKLTNFAVDNRITVYFFTVLLVISGIWAYQSTPKEQFPEVAFPYFMVTTIYPGTSPADMENLVTRPIEKQVKSVDGVKNVTSKSLQDVSLVVVEFETNVEQQTANQDVKDAVDKAKPDLPAALLDDPEVTEIDLSEFPILNINLSGDLSLVRIKELAEELQDDIESLEEVTRVDIVGALNREIQINVDLHKMQAAAVSFRAIGDAVSQENMTISGGQVNVGSMERVMRVVGEFKHVDEIENIVLRDGLYLKDVASVVDGFEEREDYSRLNSQDVITLNVIKRSGKNLINAIDKINVLLEKFEVSAPESLEITATGDQSTMTRNNVRNLFNTIILGFFVVVVVLMFFMGIDNAMFVAVAIPLSMLIAFIFLPLLDFTMNMVTLMALILVLGIVVDNSIVVVENIYRHYMNTPNLPIAPAVKRGVGEVAIPVFSGTLTTMAPFFPLIFWPGIMGEFMMYIPATIIITLAASMLVAYTMNPVFAVTFMRYRGSEKQQVNHRKNVIFSAIGLALGGLFHLFGIPLVANLIIFAVVLYLLVRYVLEDLVKKFQKRIIPRMMNGYQNTLRFLLKGRGAYIIVFSTVALLFITIFLTAKFGPKVVLFPENKDPDKIMVFLSMPSGTDLERTDSVAQIMENRVVEVLGDNNQDVDFVITNVATNAGQDIFERTTQSKLAKVTVGFVEYEYRTGPHTEIYVRQLRKALEGIPGAEIIVDIEDMGPPTGKPVNLEISGENIETLIELSEYMRSYIVDTMEIAGIEELKSDMEVSKPEILINIDRRKARGLGISTAYIGSTLRTAIYGSEVSKLRDGEDEYPIMVRLDKRYRDDIQALLDQTLMVPAADGKGVNTVPISSVVDVRYQSSYGGIIRKDYERVITLSSNILDGYNANEIVSQLKMSLAGFEMPDGYSWEFTGEQEEQEESGGFLVLALFLAIGLIFIVLVTQFNSITKPLIILVQVVFSIIGVLLGFIIFDIDISVILTGMGIIAVAGIVVKNAIILIDYLDAQIKDKPGEARAREKVVEAGRVRLTPVLLTAASTIFGLLPLAIGMNIDFVSLLETFDPNIYFGGINAIFWGPLAWTIIFGLAFATFLTLVVVPAMYFMWYVSSVKKEKRKIRKAILASSDY
ncbi:MAG: efflux RND transporter permease subunit [Salinivirgaceae bacterium]|jgi:multidrug efflux pump|nr:efflux RND transporter permease subunit [Salinivirgaceae bacterium]